MPAVAHAEVSPEAPENNSRYYGSVCGSPLREDTMDEIRATLNNIRFGRNSNRVSYSAEDASFKAYFDTGNRDAFMLVTYVSKIVRQEHSPVLRIVNGRGIMSGTEVIMFIERDESAADEKAGEQLTFADKKFRLIERAASDLISKVCTEAELAIPDGVKKELVDETVRRIVASALPQQLPLDHQYRNRPIDVDTGKRETVVKFLDRAWHDPWIASGVFNRTYFRNVDEPGEQAVQNWLRDESHTLPFPVLRRSDIYDRELNPEGIKHASRVLSAAKRRRAQGGVIEP